MKACAQASFGQFRAVAIGVAFENVRRMKIDQKLVTLEILRTQVLELLEQDSVAP